ncbi:mycothiol system anti-sigma-R factor [Georgenia faecalis]|uniref:Mycothiol system anti-sigma-R factor n=1 Tax=Georgenia faecalis TaxID=2483799 RepID=A0ABV9DCB5_9MICO|nr:mycothiol system anti-sigma-R factor [Georgenia faecalis]
MKEHDPMVDHLEAARRGWGPDLPLTDEAGPCGCEELLDRLDEFLDSEMSDSQCARLQEHAAQCPTCREATDAEQHLRAIIRRSCAEVAPAELRMRVAVQLTRLRLTDPGR